MKKNSIPLIRCLQEDVLMDKNNWARKLIKKIGKYNQ